LFYIIPHPDFIDVSTLVLDLKQEIDPEAANLDELTPGVSQEYLSLIEKRVGGADRTISLGGFGSCLDVSPDYYPILSRIDEIPNYSCAAGFSGTGFKHFPVIGRLMAEIILDRKPTYPDLVSFFRYDRFKRNKTRQGVSDSYFVRE
jgi:glycine/D-amino acid oxidase-like deaminating enzyme